MAHYFDDAPAAGSAPATVTVEVPGARFVMRTDRGVFSHGRLDAGTDVLLRAAVPWRAGGDLLDLGCGAGPIAMTLARRSPAARVWAVDVNARARALCTANASANGLANVVVAAPEDVPPALAFDSIWSNPPIRIGKAALRQLLESWLARLGRAGEALLVVHKHLGADSLHEWLIGAGWPTTRLASARGYRVLQVAPRSL